MVQKAFWRLSHQVSGGVRRGRERPWGGFLSSSWSAGKFYRRSSIQVILSLFLHRRGRGGHDLPGADPCSALLRLQQRPATPRTASGFGPM
jgi:hypothetical protein